MPASNPDDLVKQLLLDAGLPDHSEQPVLDSPEKLRALDNRLLDAKEDELRKWDAVKRASQEEATRDFLP